MSHGAETREATGEGVTELAIALSHGGSVTFQFNPYLLIEHPIIRWVLGDNALWVGLRNYVRSLLYNGCFGTAYCMLDHSRVL